MDIDKDKLSLKFKEGDWTYVFKDAQDISEFLVVSKFGIYDREVKNDMVQECLENFYKKILAKKVDPNKNLFAFIWANSRFRILEMLRKENNRSKIATFISYQAMEGFSNYIDYEAYLDSENAKTKEA